MWGVKVRPKLEKVKNAKMVNMWPLLGDWEGFGGVCVVGVSLIRDPESTISDMK